MYVGAWRQIDTDIHGGFVAHDWKAAREMMVKIFSDNMRKWAAGLSSDEQYEYRVQLELLKRTQEPPSYIHRIELPCHRLSIVRM